MSTVKEKIQADIKVAMKAREAGKVKKELLKVVLAEFSRVEDASKQLSDAEYQAIIKKTVKNLKEVGTEEANVEIAILQEYLPQELSEDYIREVINKMVADGANNIGPIMGHFKKNHEGQYDGKLVSTIARETLA